MTCGTKCGTKIGDGSYIAERLANVSEQVHVARTKHEACPQLEWVLAELVLSMSGSVRTLASDRVLAAKQMQKRPFPKSRGAISTALRIDKQREGDVSFLAEKSRIVQVTQPDGSQVSTALPELLFMLAQLRDMLAAEDSTVMAKKHDHRGTIGPQSPEPNRAFVGVGQNDIRQFRAKGLVAH